MLTNWEGRTLSIKELNQDKLSQEESDEALMLAYAKGNASAFEQLYQRHKVIVFRFFTRQSLPLPVAEELTHDTWLKIINARARYVATAKFTTYLFTVARRVAIDYQNKKNTRCELSNEEAVIEQLSVVETKQADDNKRRVLNQALKQQIALLPIEQREVFLLKQESGFSIEDIATITQQNKEKVKSRWRYALKKLREGLSFYVN